MLSAGSPNDIKVDSFCRKAPTKACMHWGRSLNKYLLADAPSHLLFEMMRSRVSQSLPQSLDGGLEGA